MAILQDQSKTTADYEAMIAKLTAENTALKRAVPSGGIKVSEKGAVSVYGLGRFPVTLYKDQWLALLNVKAPSVLAFIEAHPELKSKGD